ncbi:MAG: hypothetical protein ACE14P_04925 [Methanotrichaceae archaeon]
MKKLLAIAVIFACMLLANIAPSTGEKAKGSGDWLSGGYVVNHHPVYNWGPGIAYPVYYDSAVFDPWYRNVAWPFLSNSYWSPSYYRNGVMIYPVFYDYPTPYRYDSDWRYPIYP